MPRLEGFPQLGAMLFLAAFGAFYLFWPPQRRGMRGVFGPLFFGAIAVSNEQVYHFSVYANTVAGAFLSLVVTAFVAHLPGSPRPEKVFLRLQRRFFRQSRWLLGRLARDRRGLGPLGRIRVASYRSDLLEIPRQLGTLADQLDYRLLPGTEPETVRVLVAELITLGLRIRDLLEAREEATPDARLDRVLDALQDLRERVQSQLGRWAEDPAAAAAPVAALRARRDALAGRLEADLDEARERFAGDVAADFEPFYRYLGGFRGLSEAVLGYAGVAGHVSWPVWREARF